MRSQGSSPSTRNLANYAMKFSFEPPKREASRRPPFEVSFESLPYTLQLKKQKEEQGRSSACWRSLFQEIPVRNRSSSGSRLTDHNAISSLKRPPGQEKPFMVCMGLSWKDLLACPRTIGEWYGPI